MSEAGVAVAHHPLLVVGAEHRADRVVHADYLARLVKNVEGFTLTLNEEATGILSDYLSCVTR